MIAASNIPHPARNLDAGWLPIKIFGFIMRRIKRADTGFVAGKGISQHMVVFVSNADQATFPDCLLMLLRCRLSF